jgi:hypothetical protein
MIYLASTPSVRIGKPESRDFSTRRCLAHLLLIRRQQVQFISLSTNVVTDERCAERAAIVGGDRFAKCDAVHTGLSRAWIFSYQDFREDNHGART